MTAQTDPNAQSTSQSSAADRRHPRIACGRKLVLLLPSTCTRIQGWSYDASAEGIGFYCVQSFPDQTVYLQTDSMHDEAAEIEIVRCREVIDGLWEFGAIVHRFISETDALFACASRIDE